MSNRDVTSGAVMAMVLLAAPPARANDAGCDILLCLSNPGGPLEFSQCVPPMRKLWSDLAKGKPSPACASGGVIDARLHHDDGAESSIVTMRFADGSQRTFAVPDTETAGAGGTSVPGAPRQP